MEISNGEHCVVSLGIRLNMHCESTFHLVCGRVVADARGGVANLVELSEISSDPDTR